MKLIAVYDIFASFHEVWHLTDHRLNFGSWRDIFISEGVCLKLFDISTIKHSIYDKYCEGVTFLRPGSQQQLFLFEL